ncbi:MAG: hypothetical protein LBK62_07280 [Treponema sp.]|jgi:hypothetical protein|nr:hypothetical protein [Treponema sp.]
MTHIEGESPFEAAIKGLYRSPKTGKILSVLALVGIAACVVVLLPPAQNALISFVETSANTDFRDTQALPERLLSLLSLAVLGLAALVLFVCCLYAKKIADFLADSKNSRILSGLGLGVTALLLVFITVFSYRHGWRWLHSDHASEMILAKLLAEENVLVSTGWNYSTELRLVYQTLFSMPLFKLLSGFNNWALIRAMTIFLNNALLVVSYVFLTRQMRLPNKWIYLSAGFLLVPLSTGYWNIVTFGGYYVFFIAQNFCCLGLFFRLLAAPPPAKRRTRISDFMLFSLLSLVLGIQGIRSLLNIQIPLMLACFFAYWFTHIPQKKGPVLLGIYSLVLCGIGFIINYLLHVIYSFQSFEYMRVDDLYALFFVKLGQNVVSLFSFFGFIEGHRVLSAQGIAGILGIFFTVFLIWNMAVMVLRDRTGTISRPGGNFEPRHFMTLYFFVSLGFNMFVFLIVDDNVTQRYFIPFLVLYVPLLAVLFEKTEKRNSALSKTGLIAAVFLFIFTRAALNFQSLGIQETNSGRTGYIRYLEDNDLDFGFATFWNANVTTELTNGKISIAGLEPDGVASGEKYRIHGWLNPIRFYDPSYYTGESFLLLTRAEWDTARQAGRSFTEKHVDYDDGRFMVIRYPSAKVIHEEVLDT